MCHTSNYLKFAFLLIFILRYEFPTQTQFQAQIFEKYLEFCRQCFQHQALQCANFFQQIEADKAPNTIQDLLNFLSAKRLMRFWKFKTSPITTKSGHIKIISKTLMEKEQMSLDTSNLQALKTRFIENENLEGLQLCPQKNAVRLVQYLQQETQHIELSIWLHFLLNVEPLLMPLFSAKGFAVPKFYASCGFTLFQAYEGKALSHYYAHEDFLLKVAMAKQLLEAVLKFSKGFNGFRIYITDLTADNLIWNEATEKLYFVDLDTIIIVDSTSKHLQPQIHKHVYIECDDCFAYSQQEICKHRLSDINIFAACQLLREDLRRKREGGFLYPIPADILGKYTKFSQLLDACVDCLDTECLNRFNVAEELLQLFEVILIETRVV